MTSLPTQEQNEVLLGEMLLFGLLSKLIYQYPDREQREWFQSLIDGETFAEIPFAAEQEDVRKGQALLETWSKGDLDDETYEDMQVDHMRLFVGTNKVIAAPWESVFFNEGRQTFQEQTLAVRGWYRRYGLEPEKLYREPDDHIGLEMSFVAHLTSEALQALEDDDPEKFEELIQARGQFLSEHLLKWGFDWCELVIENASTDLYLGAAYLIRGALASMAESYELHGAAGAAK